MKSKDDCSDDKVLRWAGLDTYNYDLDQLDEERFLIVIPVDNDIDPVISDISTEITGADNHIYIEGLYLDLIKMQITKDPMMRNERELRILTKTHKRNEEIA